MSALTETIQSMSPGRIIELFEIDLRPITKTNLTSDFIYFCSNTINNGASVVWAGNTYLPWPVEAEGFEATTKGTSPRPTLSAANVSGYLTALFIAYKDLVGARVTRRRTFVQFLDAVNFPGGNASADPTQQLPHDTYVVQRKVQANKSAAKLELSSALDLEDVLLPRRVITSTYCPWQYRDATRGCTYIGSAKFTTNDQPTTDSAQDVCSKKISGCKVRFGNRVDLPFGGFPASRVYKT